MLASVYGDVSKLLFLLLLVCICGGMILKVVASYSVVVIGGSLKDLLLECENFHGLCYTSQAGELVHAVARVPKAFMVQAAAVGPSAEGRVADGSCGSCRSFGIGFSGGSVEAVGSSEESQMVACLQQSSFSQGAEWQLIFVGAVVGLMQRLLDLGSLIGLPMDDH